MTIQLLQFLLTCSSANTSSNVGTLSMACVHYSCLQGQDSMFPSPQLLSLTTIISNDKQLCQYDVGFGFQATKLVIWEDPITFSEVSGYLIFWQNIIYAANGLSLTMKKSNNMNMKWQCQIHKQSYVLTWQVSVSGCSYGTTWLPGDEVSL